jgi:Putative Flp pilus-assembly TadE/G-like
MLGIKRAAHKRSERGAALVMVAASMFVLMILAAVGIDLASLYMVRNEAQRAADAAALAGARMFASTGFVSGGLTPGAVQPLAIQAARTIGGQNNVGGQPAAIQASDVSFDFTLAHDPRITVLVQRSSARGNAVPTFFARVWGWLSADVKARATAEAYVQDVNGPVVCTSCVKPLLFVNCDPAHPTPANAACGPGFGYYVDPATHTVEHPSVIGTNITLHANSNPSQWGLLDFSGNGGAGVRQDIAKCTITTQFTCGSPLTVTKNGVTQGPTRQGVLDLIHASGQGLNQGQDSISGTGPFTFYAGANNPNVLAGSVGANTPITSSDSIVVVPLGDPPPPGKNQVTIAGFMQVFIQQFSGTDISATVLNVTGCIQSPPDTCGSGGTPGTISPPPGSPVVVRLVQGG